MIQFVERQCTLCGPSAGKTVKYPPNFSDEDLNAAVFSARRMPDRRHFRLVECNDCGIIYSDPACNPQELAVLYKKSLVTYTTQEQQIRDSYSPVLDRALPKVRNRGCFVEVGGGRGFMLDYGSSHGFTSQIEVEPSADAEKKFEAPSKTARFVRSIFKDDTLPANSASLICFFQMLDHVPDPGSFVRSVFRTLEPGGVAVCVTHNTRAVSAKVLGERSPIFDIEHTYLFAPANMTRLFKHAGFDTVEAFPISNRYALKHWLHLAPLPKSFKAGLLKVLTATGLANIRIPLRAGNFALIATKA